MLITEPARQAGRRHSGGELWGIRAQESRGRRIMLLKALAASIATDCAGCCPTPATGRSHTAGQRARHGGAAKGSIGPSRSARCGTGPPTTSSATSAGTPCQSTRYTTSSANSVHLLSCNESHPLSTPTASATAASSGSATAGPTCTSNLKPCYVGWASSSNDLVPAGAAQSTAASAMGD